MATLRPPRTPRSRPPVRVPLAALSLLLLPAWGCAGGYAPAEAPSPDQIPSLEAGRSLAPADLDLAARLGAAYRSADRLDEARDVLEGVLERDPDHEAATYFLGLVHEETGSDSAAVVLYARYAEVGEDEALRRTLAERAALVRRRLLQREVRAAVEREAQLADRPAPPGTVAVFPFLFTGSDPSLRPLARALAEMLTTDLSQTDRLVVLERLRAQTLVDEMALGDEGIVDPATAARGGRMLGAELIVQGRLDALTDEIAVEARVVSGSPEAPENRPAVSASDRLERFFDLEKLLALEIFRTLGIELTAAERERVTRNRTESLEALLAFGLGLEAQDEGRHQEAAGHFQRATSLDPSFASAAAELAASVGLVAATDLNLDGLADLGGDLLLAVLPTDPADAFLALERIVPGLLDRNPVSEFLGREGLSPEEAILEIVIPRPGGGTP